MYNVCIHVYHVVRLMPVGERRKTNKIEVFVFGFLDLDKVSGTYGVVLTIE